MLHLRTFGLPYAFSPIVQHGFHVMPRRFSRYRLCEKRSNVYLMSTSIGLAFLQGSDYTSPWPYGSRVGSIRSHACGEHVRPGGVDGCLIALASLQGR